MEVSIYDWGRVSDSFELAKRSLAELARALATVPSVTITDELTHALAQAGLTGWMAGFRWRHDFLRLVSYGERIKVRTPRREKRRARKRRLRRR